jgi:geranylgeranyl reductase family protein
MARTEFDVLVVGLGPAGSRAAAQAARAGLATLAVDRRRRAGFPVQCAEFVPAILGQEIDGLGPVRAQTIRTMRTFVEDESADRKENFPGQIIDRAAFDTKLVEDARAAGAQCRFATQLNAIDRDGRAHLSDGSVLRARCVIGADGPHSSIGQAIGQINRALVETRQITVPLHAPHDATDIFLAADILGGYGWLFPKNAIANLGVGVMPQARHRLKALLAGLHETLVAQHRVGADIFGYTGGAIPVGGMVTPHGQLGSTLVLLAGDAAGLTNPVSGAGIASAVISGTLAGQAAGDWLAGDAQAAEEYAAELDALFGRALARAVHRRAEVLYRYHDGHRPSPAALRRGWIAYEEYWAA